MQLLHSEFRFSFAKDTWKVDSTLESRNNLVSNKARTRQPVASDTVAAPSSRNKRKPCTKTDQNTLYFERA